MARERTAKRFDWGLIHVIVPYHMGYASVLIFEYGTDQEKLTADITSVERCNDGIDNDVLSPDCEKW